MARCGWVVGLLLGVACVAARSARAQSADEMPVERDGPTTRTAATRGATSLPTTRPRRPATQLAPSKRSPSKPTTKPVNYDLKPSRITLRLKKKRADQVLEHLSRQSGAVFELSDDLWPNGAPVVPRVEVIDQPFWPALRQVSLLTGIWVNGSPGMSRERGVLPIMPQRAGGNMLDGVDSGPILVQLQSINRRSRLNMADPQTVTRTAVLIMQVLVEPKFDAVPLTPPVRLERAEDDKGRPIAAQPLPPFMTRNGLPLASFPHIEEWPGIWRENVQMVLPAADGKRITKLKGFAEFAVMTNAVEIQVPDVLNVAGTDMRLPGGVHLLIHEPTVRGRDLELRIAAWNDGVDPAAWEALRRGFLHWARRVRIEANDGTALSDAGSWSSSSGVPDYVSAQMTFRLPAGDLNANCRLVWTAPAGATVLSVPFELTDIPLP